MYKRILLFTAAENLQNTSVAGHNVQHKTQRNHSQRLSVMVVQQQLPHINTARCIEVKGKGTLLELEINVRRFLEL
jgi:hypothetical protein